MAPVFLLTDREYQSFVISASPSFVAWASILAAATSSSPSANTGRIIVIEMNRIIVPFLRSGIQGNRLPDCEDRHQAGSWLHARRNPERYHSPLRPARPTIDFTWSGSAFRLRKVPRCRSERPSMRPWAWLLAGNLRNPLAKPCAPSTSLHGLPVGWRQTFRTGIVTADAIRSYDLATGLQDLFIKVELINAP